MPEGEEKSSLLGKLEQAHTTKDQEILREIATSIKESKTMRLDPGDTQAI